MEAQDEKGKKDALQASWILTKIGIGFSFQ